MKKCILIGHKARQGKDLLAHALANQLDDKYVVGIYHFADPLKRILAITLDLTTYELEEFKNKDFTYRQMLINLSDVLKKEFNEDIFAQLLVVTTQLFEDDIIIVPDFRFKNEYEYLKYFFDVVTINIKNNSVDLEIDSENELDGFDYDYKVEWSGKNKKELDWIAESLVKDIL